MDHKNVMVIADFLQALLTPAIAVSTAVIAVAQYRLAKAPRSKGRWGTRRLASLFSESMLSSHGQSFGLRDSAA
jgi:hypothetical protein